MSACLDTFGLTFLGLMLSILVTFCVVARMNGKYKKDFLEHRRKVLFAKKGWIAVFVGIFLVVIVAAIVVTAVWATDNVDTSHTKMRWIGGVGIGLAVLACMLYMSKEMQAVVTYKKRQGSSEQP